MLTTIDIEKVRTAGMTAAIASTADKVAAAYRESAEASGVRRIAEDIITIWLGAAAREVREALSQQLKHCPFLPRKLAMDMAADIESVALPMLRFSEVYSDADLLEIVQRASVEKLRAVAARDDLSFDVAEALVANGSEDVVDTLVRNDGAQLTQGLLHQIVDGFARSQPIQEGLVERAALPISIAERLMTMVAGELRQHLVERFEIPQELADGLSSLSLEAATSSSLPPRANAEVAGLFVAHLEGAERLTPTFLLRTLCDGQVEIFKAGLARRARLAIDAVAAVLLSGEREARSNLLLRADIPSFLVPAFGAAIDIIMNRTPPSDGNIASESRIREVIDRIVQQYEEIDPKDLESVLMRLAQIIDRCVTKRPPVPVDVEPKPASDSHFSRSQAWGTYDPDKGAIKFGVGNALIVKKKPTNGHTRH